MYVADPKTQGVSSRLLAALILLLGALVPLHASAQVPARFYWKTMSGGNAVPLIFESINGNSNPFDSAHLVNQDANLDATIAIAGYARTFTLHDRSAMAAVIVPMGRVSGDLNVAGSTVSQSARGFGDPMLEFDLNLVGPPAQKNIPDAMRYEPGFTIDLLADLALPIGEYDSSRSISARTDGTDGSVRR